MIWDGLEKDRMSAVEISFLVSGTLLMSWKYAGSEKYHIKS